MSIGLALVSREYPPFFGGGIGTYARHIAPALAEAGCRVHVVTQAYDETHPRVSRQGNLVVHRIPLIGSAACWTSATARFAAAAARKVAELAEDGLVDVAEFAECEGAGAALAAGRMAGCAGIGGGAVGVPTVVHLHTPTELLYALRSVAPGPMTGTFAAYLLAERASMLAADRLCAPSAFIADWAVEHYGLLERPRVIPYAIEGLPPMPPPPPPGTHKRVLYVGRIEPRKGVEPLIRAWPEVVRRHPQWRLRMVGADTSTAPGGVSMRGYLTELLPPETRGTVQFVGALPPQMLASEYAEATVCTVPSLWENFPNTCIEAMSHARPVLVSDAGGMVEMIGGTRAGVSFRSGDPADLARAMSALLSESEGELRERGRAARERIAKMCDKNEVVSRRLELYRETIERGRARGGRAEGRDRGAALRLWRLMRDIARGNLAAVDLPRLDPVVAQWIGAGEGAAA